jgi:hypothetical protein
VTTIGFHTLANHVVTEMVWLGVHAYSAALCVIFIQLPSHSAKNMLFIAAGIVQYSIVTACERHLVSLYSNLCD